VGVASDLATFDELVGYLRERLGIADAANAAELHSFKDLMQTNPGVVYDAFYWEAFEELQAQGYFHRASSLVGGGDAIVGSPLTAVVPAAGCGRDVLAALG
jgi:hypothetical protein